MGETTKIEWADHTFNAWQGCEKVSPECANCYAETLNNRWGRDIWGPEKPRPVTGDAYWRQADRWNEAARAAGVRRRVFVNSLSDVFEDRADLDATRARLWNVIERCTSLDWLLLTKRPENILSPRGVPVRWFGGFPRHVWAGVTVGVQPSDWRIGELVKVPAVVRFLSIEPLLGPVELSRSWIGTMPNDEHPPIRWVIVGGESGQRARPMHPEWVRSIRDQCVKAGVPFFFKQWGEFAPEDEPRRRSLRVGDHVRTELKAHGGAVWRVGKIAAGRELDGRTWDEFPEVARA